MWETSKREELTQIYRYWRREKNSLKSIRTEDEIWYYILGLASYHQEPLRFFINAPVKQTQKGLCYQLPFLLHLLEKAMTPYSSTLAWKIPWTEEPGGLQSLGSLRVRYDWVTSLSLFTFTQWTKKRQSTPVFLPGESQGRRSLVGCRLWGRTESDTTEAT